MRQVFWGGCLAVCAAAVGVYLASPRSASPHVEPGRAATAPAFWHARPPVTVLPPANPAPVAASVNSVQSFQEAVNMLVDPPEFLKVEGAPLPRPTDRVFVDRKLFPSAAPPHDGPGVTVVQAVGDWMPYADADTATVRLAAHVVVPTVSEHNATPASRRAYMPRADEHLWPAEDDCEEAEAGIEIPRETAEPKQMERLPRSSFTPSSWDQSGMIPHQTRYFAAQQHLRRVAATPSASSKAVPADEEESEVPLPTFVPCRQVLDTLEFRPSDDPHVLLPGRVF